jgi:hypothetical protein
MANEENLSHYEVEHSRNSTVFSKGIKVALKNNNTTDYEWWHIQPEEGFHFYRIRAVDNNGNDLLSRVVKVNIGPEKPEFKVYPTIVNASSDITLEMTSLKKGNYTIQISDMSGKVIVTQTINHAGGSAAQMVRLPSALALGRYNVSLMGENNEKYLDVILKN